jgi:hypothetical protein
MTIRLGQAAQDPDVPSGRQSPAGRNARILDPAPFRTSIRLSGWGPFGEASSC